MSKNTIDAEMLFRMFLAGADNLKANKEWINELNVFPVPDGDTGTNMTMTIMSAVREVAGLGNDYDMMTLCKAINSGSLRGARGNSGVILSQLLRGFCKGVRDYKEIDIKIIAEGCDRAVETAYKAVMKPKEGTILTVAKGVAAKAREVAESGETDLDKCFASILEHGDEVLASTPDMLPVLKQAGVVDSGGQGLMQVLKGCLEGYRGKVVTPEDIARNDAQAKQGESQPKSEAQEKAVIRFGYCTEFVILLDKKSNIWNTKTEKDFKAFLETIGDSIACVADEEAVKVHVHTNDPGLAIQRALMYGQLSDLKIDNMRLEHEETLHAGAEKAAAKEPEQQEKMPRKSVAFIAVSVGEGLSEIFRGLGVDYVLSGGQTMNPSTEDMLEAISKVNADTIFILPNNKNIILAANQAAGMTKDCKVIVIPTRTIPQGITAVINYMPEVEADVNTENMTEEIKKVKSAEVTYSVRDTVIEDTSIKEGDIMGIGDSGILAVGKDRDETTIETLQRMVTPDTALISIYYGSDISSSDADHFSERVKETFPQCDIELQAGGQPIYYYILSAEE
ncbi:MAG: DAK2 domain-containing protein [Lachnospiraceae bacterium]|jgi:DAK2 domain fusion protein YloV|nr:DAK2 domain-containing protein [Lachnospiraceae bacterium]